MGLATGIPFLNLNTFVRSLRAASDADVIIFLNSTTPDIDDLFTAYRVTAVVFDPAVHLPVHTRGFHPSSYRWLLIRDHLAGMGGGVGVNQPGPPPHPWVLLCDVRDTVFQSDPFTRALSGPPSALYAFLEARPTTIRRDGWNSGWVRDCYGAEVLAQVGGNIVSCSGTTLGSWARVGQYVELMAQEVARNPMGCERNGIDQGVHNVIVHQRRIQDLVAVENDEGWVATVQAMRMVVRDSFGRVVTARGQPYAVVHQWDRSPALTAQYAVQFPWVPEQQRRERK